MKQASFYGIVVCMNNQSLQEKLLKSHQFKVTPARLEILHILSESQVPLDAEAIFKKLKDKQTNNVTVYRTLTSFAKKGIVRRVDLRKDAVCFELADNHHHHIVCTDCGDVEDVDVCLSAEIQKTISSKSKKFKTITDHSLEFFGQCKKCR